ncbi:MAG TPA: hypothetical protein VGF88_10065 [Acidobacteriaceae bacterium]
MTSPLGLSTDQDYFRGIRDCGDTVAGRLLSPPQINNFPSKYKILQQLSRIMPRVLEAE